MGVVLAVGSFQLAACPLRLRFYVPATARSPTGENLVALAAGEDDVLH